MFTFFVEVVLIHQQSDVEIPNKLVQIYLLCSLLLASSHRVFFQGEHATKNRLFKALYIYFLIWYRYFTRWVLEPFSQGFCQLVIA